MRAWLIRGLLSLLVLGVIIVVVCVFSEKSQSTPVKASLATETFIQNYLLNKEGFIQTNITDQNNVYLSESVGLWLEYLIEKNDSIQFKQQVEVLEKYFLTKDHLVPWKIEGTKKYLVNASIDDLRIVNSLYIAGEKWKTPFYTNLAKKMSKSLVRNQSVDQLMVDYIDLTNMEDKGEIITLSYIIPESYKRMSKVGILSDEMYEETKDVLLKAPRSKIGFYPKEYNIKTGKYSYDQKVNLIDQFYVGLHEAQWGGDVSPLFQFAKKAFKEGNGKIYGQYDSETAQPIVQYEAPAVYALAILMCIEIDEREFAKQLYSQMLTLRQNQKKSPYYGGYIDVDSKDTHSFDNLLPIIAERRGMNEKVF